jgi:hypothetical protein
MSPLPGSTACPYGEKCPSPEPFLHNPHPSLKIPGTRSYFQIPQRVSYGKDASHQSVPLHYLQGPQ